MILLSGIPVSGFNSQCGFSDCWDLYQQAQESLRISDMYPLTWVSKHSLPVASLMPSEIEKRCTAFRTFYKCLATASRGCLGDLNFHSAHKGTEKQMNIYGCPTEGPIFEQQYPLASPVPLACTYSEGSSEDSDFESEHGVCGIFGGLHLVMFDYEHQTCNILGAWPLVDNEHFTVQVTAEKNHLGSFLAKVTVVIKQDEECALADRYVLYQATSTELPPTFSDGSTSFGAFDNVKLEEVETNRLVTITIRHIDTVIRINCIQQALSIFIKTPDEFATSLDGKLNSVQLCFIGCPAPMQVNVQSFFKSSHVHFQSDDQFSKQGMPTSAPRGGKQLSTLPRSDGFESINYETSFFVCRSLEPSLVGYFLNSCIYDIMSSGDSSLAVLSAAAMNTTLAFVGRIRDAEEFTEANVRRHVSGASPSKCCFPLVTLLLICITLNHSTIEILFTLSLKRPRPSSSESLAASKHCETIRKNTISLCQSLFLSLENLMNSFLHLIPTSARNSVSSDFHPSGLGIVSRVNRRPRR